MEEKFESVDNPEKVAVYASKILMYSRKMDIGKIAEVLGGKGETAKKVLEGYVAIQNFRGNKITNSLRCFLQSFRMAGVEAQVIFKIIEQFAHKFFAVDTTKTFVSQIEANEFAYLLIVLHTC